MVMWAQRPNLIFLTVCLEDCKDPEIKVDNDKLFFKSIGGPEKKMHELTINLFKEVDPEVNKLNYITLENLNLNFLPHFRNQNSLFEIVWLNSPLRKKTADLIGKGLSKKRRNSIGSKLTLTNGKTKTNLTKKAAADKI